MIDGMNKTGSTKLETWKDRIRSGLRYQRYYGQSKKWNVYKNMYRGFFGNQNAKQIPVNLIFSQARSIIPQVYFRSPRMGVIPMKPGFAPHAWVIERVDNYLIRELDLKYEFKSMILEAYLCGVGPAVLGYDSEFGYNPDLNAVELGDGSLSQFDKKGNLLEYGLNIKPGMPWLKASSASDFIVPWGTRKWEEAPWYAFRRMRPLADIKKDNKYDNTSKLTGPFNSALDASAEARPMNANQLNNEDFTEDWVELWEIHDLQTRKVMVLTLDHDKFLREDEDMLQHEGLNALVLGFNEDPDYFWWPSDARQIEKQQLEMNDIRTVASKHRKVALLKMLVDKTMMNKDELSKLLDGDVKAAAFIDAGTGGDIRKAVAFLQSHVPPDFAVAAQEVRGDVREIVGFSRNQAGSFEEASGRRTATEAAIVQRASTIRINERRDIMADVLEKTVRKMNQMVFDFWTVERIIDIVGADGQKYWIRFTGPEIKSEVNYRINAEESLPQDQSTRRAEAEKLVALLQGAPGVDMGYLIRQYTRQFDWLDPQMLFPQTEGAGRSPEKAMSFQEFQGVTGRAQQQGNTGLA